MLNKLAIGFLVSIFCGNALADQSNQDQINDLKREIDELRNLVIKKEVATQKVSSQLEHIELYGSVRSDISYIIEGTDNDFSSVHKSNGTTSDKLRATLKATRIGLNIKDISGYNIGGKIETDFVGSSGAEALRIRHSYITYNNWLIGQTTSNFLSNNAPEMIDYGTNIGSGTTRIPQVRYSFQLNPSTQLLFSAEKGNSSGTDIQYKFPNLTAKVNHKYQDSKGTFSARVLLENYEATTAKKDKIGYGISIGSNFNLNESIKISGDISRVVGNSNYLDGGNNAFSLNPVNQDIEQNKFSTYLIGATYKFSPQFRSTIGYGGLYSDDDTSYAKYNPSDNKEVRQVWANLVYSPVPALDFSIEYIDGLRKTFNAQSYQDDRLSLAFKYNF